MADRLKNTFTHVLGSDPRITLSSREPLPPSLGMLTNTSGMLMISMKSRKFSKGFIEKVLKFSNYNFRDTWYTVVDAPYAFNVLAEDSSLEVVRSEISKLIKIRDEVERRVEKIVLRFSLKCEYLTWKSICDETPAFFFDEVGFAFRHDVMFRANVHALVEGYIGEVPRRIDTYSMFFLSELPAILYLYSGLRSNIIDFYPGDNPRLIWDIMEGVYVSSMPKISEQFSLNKSFIYADVREVNAP